MTFTKISEEVKAGKYLFFLRSKQDNVPKDSNKVSGIQQAHRNISYDYRKHSRNIYMLWVNLPYQEHPAHFLRV